MTAFEEPLSVTIDESRWCVTITVVDRGGIEHVYVAGADLWHTEHNGIWFGTAQEYDDYE